MKHQIATLKVTRELIVEVFDLDNGAEHARVQLTPEAARDLAVTLEEFARGAGPACHAKLFVASSVRRTPSTAKPIKLRTVR